MKLRQKIPVNKLNCPDPVKLSQENAKLKIRIKQIEREKNTSNTALFHYITEIRGQLMADQFVIGVKKWVIQNQFVDKVYTICDIIQTHITVTHHRATHPT